MILTLSYHSNDMGDNDYYHYHNLRLPFKLCKNLNMDGNVVLVFFL